MLDEINRRWRNGLSAARGNLPRGSGPRRLRPARLRQAWLVEPLERRLLMTASTFAQDVIADGAIAYWPLNDSSTANGATAVSLVDPTTYNGTYQSGNQPGNGVTIGPGPLPALGTAAYFRNTVANATLPTSDAVIAPNVGLPAGDSDRTLIFWAKDNLPAADDTYHVTTEYGITGTQDAAFGSSVFTNSDPNAPYDGMAASQWGDGAGTTTSFTDGQWHFFAVTVSGGNGSPTYQVYADGVLETTKAIGTDTVLGMAMSIGASTALDGATVAGWNGGLSNVAVFGTALSSNQIGQLYNDAGNGAGLSVISTHDQSFQQGDGPAAADSYVLTVTSTGSVPTSGNITISDTLPAGVTLAAAPAGNGWTTTAAAGDATFTAAFASNALAPGSSTPPLVVHVQVAGSAASGQSNVVTATDAGNVPAVGATSDMTLIRSAATFSQDVIADGALAFWPLNDASTAAGATAVSLVHPATYNGTYQSGNQTGDGVTVGPAAYPALGTAAYFHNTTANTDLGTSDAVIAPNTNLPTGNSDRTLIFWAQDGLRGADGSHHVTTEYGTPGTDTSAFGTYVLNQYNPQAPLNGMAVSQWGNATGTVSPFTDGQWHFFAVTVSGGGPTPTYLVYADGVLQNIQAIPTDTILGLATTIGSSIAVDGSSIQGWYGGLGDVAMFGTALSGDQIAQLYADAPNGAGLTVSAAPSSAGFQQGDDAAANDSYTISVTNSGNQPTSGTITVTDTLPPGITLSAPPAGSGWLTTATAGASTFTATYSAGPLLPGQSAPPLVVPVVVASFAQSGNINAVRVLDSGATPAVAVSNNVTMVRSTSTYTHDVLSDLPVAFWPLNDSDTSSGAVAHSLEDPLVFNGVYQAGDQPGNGVTSGPAAYPALGTAAYFHNTPLNNSLATSDAVIAHGGGLPAGNDDRTLVFWAKDAVLTPDPLYHTAVVYGVTEQPGNSFGATVFKESDLNDSLGGMAASQWGDGTGTTTPFTDGQWHFFAVTVSGGGASPTYQVYADGVLQSSKSLPTDTILDLATTIGAATSNDGTGIIGWNGGLGGVAIYAHALSGNQIAQMYADTPNADPTPFQNPATPLDVNGDGLITPIDALVLINQIDDGDGGTLTPSASGSAPPYYVDPNGDNSLTPLDPLAVINQINDATPTAAVSSAATQSAVAPPDVLSGPLVSNAAVSLAVASSPPVSSPSALATMTVSPDELTGAITMTLASLSPCSASPTSSTAVTADPSSSATAPSPGSAPRLASTVYAAAQSFSIPVPHARPTRLDADAVDAAVASMA